MQGKEEKRKIIIRQNKIVIENVFDYMKDDIDPNKSNPSRKLGKFRKVVYT